MSDDNYDGDYDYSKKTYIEMIEKGREGVEEMIEVAKMSEHPRAYEVLATLIKTVGDQTDKLMELNKKYKEITKPVEEQKELPGPTTNNIFVGSATELQKALMQGVEVEGEFVEQNSDSD